MVRVISVHHFDSQSIQTCEDPVAVTAAPSDRLLIALAHHVVEVRDLSNNGDPVYSFPTVDQVAYLLYCTTGNYVATLETKISRQGRETVYTRVYANWDRRNSCSSDQQPMRARIAGRVTPSSSQTGGDALEMIELPVRFSSTTTIACCQATGNLLVSCRSAVCLFQLVSRTHDISRLRFLDFELWPVTLELSFAPVQLAIVEDVVAAMDEQSLHVFRINKGVTRASDWSERSSSSGSPSVARAYVDRKKVTASQEKVREKRSADEPVDLDALVKDYNSPSCILLPTIEASRHDLQTTPFKVIQPGAMGIAIKEMPANEPWAEQMTTMVETLLQLQVNKEQLHCLQLRPLYRTSTNPPVTHSECPRLRSLSYSRLVAFNCLVATHQEAYLYHFPVENGDTVNLGQCIAVYSFTSPVSHICMESYLLHALTTTGLETYTLRSTHAIYTSIPADDPVCLVGLRPFMGTMNLLILQSQLVVLASSDEHSSWTIYSLKLPSPKRLYEDIVNVASTHQYSVSSTYRHLLCEAHAILYASQYLAATPSAVQQKPSTAYKVSCQRLADFYLLSNNESDWEMGTELSDETGDPPSAVVARLLKVQSEAKEHGIETDSGQGLAHYIKHCLSKPQQDLWIPPAVLENLTPSLLSGLLLQSQKLREATTERLIDSLRKHLLTSKEPVECLAVIALCVDRGQADEAKTLLESLPDNSPQVISCLLQNWTLLVDNMRKVESDKNQVLTFSDMGVLLMQTKPQLLALILAALVTEKRVMDLQQVLQVFLAYLPSRMGVAGTAASGVLQGFLERVLVHNGRPNLSHPPTREALQMHFMTSMSHRLCYNDGIVKHVWKPRVDVQREVKHYRLSVISHLYTILQILMRSYLSDLRVNKNGVSSQKVSTASQNPFTGRRPLFLQLLPPFMTPEHPSLIKLEWLVCSGWLDSECLAELSQYVKEVLPTCLSLQILSQSGMSVLIDQCPKAVPQYAKDMLKTENEMNQLITILEDKAEKDKFTYEAILEDVLVYLSETLSPEALWRVLPKHSEAKTRYKKYLVTCQKLAHANHIRSVIIATARQLLATLNL